MTIRTLLLTDVVDSTRLVERVGDARAAELWAAHDRRSRALLAQHRGREIDRTDGFFLLFEEPTDAARYALGYHQALAELSFSARVGFHVGSVTLRKNSPEDIARGAKPIEIEGLAKPLAARVMALAGGGQTLMSGAARDALADTIPEGTAIEWHGHYRLKGIEEPIEILELGVRDSSPFSPPADTDKAYRVVRAHGDIWRPVREVRQNLPAERDAFVGRTIELRSLAARLDAGIRLLTVLGPGGTGKTRLVRRYAWSWLGDWPGGVYFCDLSEARSLDGIYFSVASALEVPLGKDDPAVQLGHAIAGRGRCLVVVDNFEQVVQYAPDTLGRWLDQARDAAFVVTSRERLHLGGEAIFSVEPLPLTKDAVDLFVARARSQKPDFVLGESNRAAVAEVVRLLDGLPLAIELAAARVRLLSPAQIVERMRDRFGLLAGARGAAAHQATLRAAIDWSWDLLTPWEQAAFAQCSIFDGGFTLEAAEGVLDLCAWPQAPAAMEVVHALSDKSLLRTWIPATQSRYDIEEPYFGMYLSIHEYAAEKLAASGHEAKLAAEERHGRYFARFGTEDALEALSRQGGVKLRRVLALELDNLVAACHRAVGRANGEYAVATYQAVWAVLELQGPGALGIDLGSQVLSLDTFDAQRAAALHELGTALRRAGRTEEAASRLEQALGLSRASGDRRREAGVLSTLGNLRRDQGRMVDARALLETAIAMAREIGNRRFEGNLIGNLGVLHAVQGRLDEARAHFEQALAVHREVGNRRFEGIDTSNLGNVYQDQGKLEEARAHYEQALIIHREVGNRRDEGIVVGNLGLLCSGLGRMNEACQLCEEALAIGREVGDRQMEGAFLGGLADVLRDLGRIEESMVHCEQALALHRAVGNRRAEGVDLGRLSQLLTKQGRFSEGREALRAGEALLREVGDRLALAFLLCKSGHTELAGNDVDAARAALAAAEEVVEAMGAGPDSEAGRAVAKLRSALA
jgi:predicted ATPase/class 3 adenylate cyclase/Tfp pilus assembly protein PilF